MLGQHLTIRFKHLASVSALVCFTLALVCLLAPDLLLALWSVDFSAPVGLVCRRSGALFAGVGVMLLQVRLAPPSPARTAVATGLIVSCSILALLGVGEFVAGHAGPGILLAVALELALALGFGLAS